MSWGGGAGRASVDTRGVARLGVGGVGERGGGYGGVADA